MPTIKLLASANTLDSGVSVSSAANMYTDISSTTYATITNGNSSTSARYAYIHGFDLSLVPTGATVQKCTLRIKGYYSGGTNYQIYLYDAATKQQIPSPSGGGFQVGYLTTSVSTKESPYSNVAGMTAGYWSTWLEHGSNLAFRIDVRRNKKNTASKFYIYGVEIEVEYTEPTPSGDPPVITVGTPSTSRISAITGHDQCVCTFTSDLALQQWEARATKAGVTPARGVGLLVESGTTLAANTPATIYVENEELTQGDGEYTITVYGQSTDGVWSA